MGFIEKELSERPTITVAGRQLKCYVIDQPDMRWEPEVMAAAEAMLPMLIAPSDETAGSGWVVMHRGGDGGAYLLVYNWVWDNVLEVRTAAAAQPVLDCTDDDPTNFVVLDRPWIGCVWELAVLEHERAAWVQWMLSPDEPNLAGYLADVRTDAMVGR